MDLTVDGYVAGYLEYWNAYFLSWFSISDDGFPDEWLSGKESTCNAGDTGSIPGSGRSPGKGNGSPLQYSCLENPVDRGGWRATVQGVAKSWTRPSTHDTQRWPAGENPHSHQKHRFTGAKFTMVTYMTEMQQCENERSCFTHTLKGTVTHWLLLAGPWGTLTSQPCLLIWNMGLMEYSAQMGINHLKLHTLEQHNTRIHTTLFHF